LTPSIVAVRTAGAHNPPLNVTGSSSPLNCTLIFVLAGSSVIPLPVRAKIYQRRVADRGPVSADDVGPG
jgi:hypothetical protein